jgi:hypothetical protein
LKGYPSKHRVRRAFWNGVRASRRQGTGNPYKNRRLKVLWKRGRDMGRKDPAWAKAAVGGQRGGAVRRSETLRSTLDPG